MIPRISINQYVTSKLAFLYFGFLSWFVSMLSKGNLTWLVTYWLCHIVRIFYLERWEFSWQCRNICWLRVHFSTVMMSVMSNDTLRDSTKMDPEMEFTKDWRVVHTPLLILKVAPPSHAPLHSAGDQVVYGVRDALDSLDGGTSSTNFHTLLHSHQIPST